jgi:hypothetical protein
MLENGLLLQLREFKRAAETVAATEPKGVAKYITKAFILGKQYAEAINKIKPITLSASDDKQLMLPAPEHKRPEPIGFIKRDEPPKEEEMDFPPLELPS